MRLRRQSSSMLLLCCMVAAASAGQASTSESQTNTTATASEGLPPNPVGDHESEKAVQSSEGLQKQDSKDPTKDSDDGSTKAVERPPQDDQKQMSREEQRNWKRWVRNLLLREHIQDFVLLDGLLSHAWNRKGRPSRKMRANVLVYLENDDRRARTFALESALESSSRHHDVSGSTMMAPLNFEEGHNNHQLFEGMILQVDYQRGDGGFYNHFHDKLQIPVCQNLETASAALYAIDTYQLLEPLHLELGVSAKHAIDFAYTPVELSDVPTRKQEYHNEYYSPFALVDERAQYTDSTSWWQWWLPFGTRNSFWKGHDEQYKMSETAFAGGSHGEVWRGRRLCRDEHGSRRWMGYSSTVGEGATCRTTQDLIFKRLKVEHGYRLLEAGLREVYIGKLLAEEESANGLFTNYVNHFFREVPKKSTTLNPWTEGENDLELWIVFEDAGPSLRSYLYAPVSTGDFVVFQHSPAWTKLRQSAAKTSKRRKATAEKDMSISVIVDDDVDDDDDESQRRPKGKAGNNTVSGSEVMKEILRQVLTSAAFLHKHGIVHRDIKPSNTMCKTNLDLDTLRVRGGNGTEKLEIECVLGDFSSAWDSYTGKNLYTNGPSIEELTIEYAPPEALLGSSWDSFEVRRPQSYDSWSIGVLALELLLGSPSVFSVDQRTTALLTNKMQKRGASEKEIRRALYLAALSQFCIYVPSSTGSKSQRLSWPLRKGDPLYKIAMVKESCTLRDFHQALRARDPLGLGFDQSTDNLLQLIWGLLAWDPMDRITAEQALEHPYFTSSPKSNLVPGDHNALESQMLDPGMDFNVTDNVDQFICPKCGRVFNDWQSCHHHANARKHAKFCTYDRSKLPSSVNAHSMLPAHPKSGYYDIQGRRPTIEDFHSIHLIPSKEFFAVYDGHTGNIASKFAASTVYDHLTSRLAFLDEEVISGTVGWKESVKRNITEAFADIHQQFLKAVSFAGHGAMDNSGTTATAVYVTDEAVVVASIGDSRAVLSSSKGKNDGRSVIEMSAIQLTKDHVASDAEEAASVKSRGGKVSVVNGLARVNGALAITRSIGDAPLANVLSRVPHVISMTRAEVQDMCGTNGRDEVPCFIVLASDGLWDMISNQEAVDLVAQTISKYQSNSSNHVGGAFQEASEVLTLEAYVRGSTDNIGVCVISLN
ncbi:linked kinase-associated serine/threonine phosphatase 2C [Seminavis robusta]|uniref:Linked kinase-associated serine/threonine phosphatase 2C n=1 Tax=Seminavis robusta TaxID=568900 RepID=A0A9N8HFH9_9STRA|nr:linked kinase-associated serine/threonine phosphatase 2C [Seminavis robusta]|eukprot:Sro457_g146800.1 linked kinase-associated serine/threonine phosphatase 2C (1161) ;mRNA; f:5930-9657